MRKRDVLGALTLGFGLWALVVGLSWQAFNDVFIGVCGDYWRGFIGGRLFACLRLLLVFCNWREFVGGFIGGRLSEFYWRFVIGESLVVVLFDLVLFGFGESLVEFGGGRFSRFGNFLQFFFGGRLFACLRLILAFCNW